MKTNILAGFNQRRKGLIKMIGQEAENSGWQAYLVGGAVRDLILKKKDLDIDIVIEGDVLKLAPKLARRFNTELICHQRFGTAVLSLPNGLRVDLATARKERYPYPGALPVVKRGRIYDDLFRRDFSMNAIAVKINPDSFGEFVDEFQGREDLFEKKIRVLHNKSFDDDPTRILRAIRFEQRLNFHLEKETLRLLKKALKTNKVSSVKPPRYFEEFKKILKEPHPQRALKRLNSLNGLGFLDPRFCITRTFLNLCRHLQNRIRNFEKAYSLKESPLKPWIIYFSALVLSLPFEKVKVLCQKFQFSMVEQKKIFQCLDVDPMIKRFLAKQMAPSEVYRLLKPLAYEAIVFFQARAHHPRVSRRVNDFLKKYASVTLDINGRQLQSLGVHPGPKVGRVLDTLLEEKLNGLLRSQREELNRAKELAGG